MKADAELKDALERLETVLAAETGLDGAPVTLEEQQMYLAGVDAGMKIAAVTLKDVLSRIESI